MRIFKRTMGALLCITLLVALCSVTCFAAEEQTPKAAATHSHPICGSTCTCASSHSASTWKVWDGTTKMYSNYGHYYLEEDIVLDSTMILDYGYTTYLCLNGHSITCEDTVFEIYSNRSLLISDCKGTGKIETTDGECAISNNKYLSVWGGTIINSSRSISDAVMAWEGTTTYVCGGRLDSVYGSAIYADAGSNITISGGTLHSGTNNPAINGVGQDMNLGTLKVTGGSITTDSTYEAVSYSGNFTMTGGNIDGNVDIWATDGITTVSGGTINGKLITDSAQTTISGGDMSLSLSGAEATISAGTFRGDCHLRSADTTVSGGNFTACNKTVIGGPTWICGGSFGLIQTENKNLYLSGVPGIETIQMRDPGVVSAQSPDGTGSFGGEAVEVMLDHPSTTRTWQDGDVIVKNVTQDVVAQKFSVGGSFARWMTLERSGNQLLLRVVPHGSWGDNVTWGIEDGVLTISGTGALAYAHSGREYPWGDYTDQITQIIVELGITSIPSYAFEYCEEATAISLPETLTDLSLSAFNDCGSLNNLVLPASLETIDPNHNVFIRCESLTDLYYMGTEEEWDEVRNSGTVVSYQSNMTIHFLELEETTATCTEGGLEAYYHFSEPAVYGGMYNLNKQPITSLSTVPALGHRVITDIPVLLDPVTVENDDTAPFALIDGVYYSTNKEHSSTSSITFTAEHDCTLTLNYGVSSERNYDKFTITHNGTNKATISGDVTGQTMTLTLSAGDIVVAKYSKDSSASSYQDQGWVELDYEMISATEPGDVQADTIEPDCDTAVICDYCQTVVKPAGHKMGQWSVATEATCTENGQKIRVCSACGETETSDLPALGHRVIVEQQVQVDPLVVANDAAKPFTLTDEVFYSSNTQHNSKSSLTITAVRPCALTLNYGVSSEQNYDKLTITHNGTVKTTISGVVTGKTTTLSLSAGDVVVISYSKDGSASKNQDQGWVQLVYDMVFDVEREEVQADTLEPDCDNAVICDYCHTVVKPAGHQMGQWSVATEATCTENGQEIRVCSACGESETRDIPMSGHHEVEDIRESTCTEDGGKYRVCDREGCDYEYLEEVYPATGHSNREEVDTPATCTESGIMRIICTVCGNVDLNAIPETGHAYVSTVTEPTCLDRGYTTHTCSVCGDSYVDSYVDENGHDYEDVVTAPTCTDRGYTNHICSVCGSNYVDSWVPAAGHSWDEGVVTTPATEETEGVLTYTCTVCGETKEEPIPAIVHSYDDGVVTTQPTCTEPGIKTFTCEDCGKTYTEEVEATGHSHEAVVTEPTCTEQGYTTYTCHCGDNYKDNYVDATGHSHEATVTAPTCTEQGYTTYTCHCGDSYKDSYVEATGHNYDDGKITTPAKYMTPGEKTFTCQGCGHSYTEEVARLTVPFVDVEEGRFYYTPMLWALDNSITAGTTKTTFAPEGDCTRGQVVTFLWRAAGCPEPTTTEHPFTDVREKGFYYKAMLWAVENGITAGTSKTTFEPDAKCTRAQVVTFLWRAQGKPAPASDAHNFTDVSSKGFYYKAMLWAVENGITAGTSKTKFSPEDTCNRGQVVTFLYRVYN